MRAVSGRGWSLQAAGEVPKVADGLRWQVAAGMRQPFVNCCPGSQQEGLVVVESADCLCPAPTPSLQIVATEPRTARLGDAHANFAMASKSRGLATALLQSPGLPAER